jgi:hypothetical protein
MHMHRSLQILPLSWGGGYQRSMSLGIAPHCVGVEHDAGRPPLSPARDAPYTSVKPPFACGW